MAMILIWESTSFSFHFVKHHKILQPPSKTKLLVNKQLVSRSQKLYICSMEIWFSTHCYHRTWDELRLNSSASPHSCLHTRRGWSAKIEYASPGVRRYSGQGFDLQEMFRHRPTKWRVSFKLVVVSCLYVRAMPPRYCDFHGFLPVIKFST